jgi:nucleoporin POM152
VLRNRPSISFSTSKPIWILEGGVAHLPISLSGRGPFNVGIKLPSGEQRDITLSGSARTLEVGSTGDYELNSVSDSVCKGSIDTRQILSVLSFSKPSMTISGTSDVDLYKNDVCVDSQVAFQVDLHGKAPFKVLYAHTIKYTDPGKKDETKELSEIVDTFYLKLMMDTSKPGTHTFKFLGVSDDNYKNYIRLDRPLIVTQKVNPAPSATFIEPAQKVFHCSTKNAPPYKLMMNLVGKAPFSVSIEQKRDGQHVRNINMNNIGAGDDVVKNKDGSFTWTPETKSINMMGKHEFSLQSLSDQSGCSASFDGSEVSTFLEIADQARITTFNPPDLCIGDLLSYTLQGTPPFTIGYTWKGVPQPEITVADPMLSFWVGAAGKLTITKVCNSADCCDESVSADLGLTSEVHELPKAVVGDGDDSFDDIKEGDESSFSIDFEGEPPFSFTYTRSRTGASALKEELFTVTDIKKKHVSFI